MSFVVGWEVVSSFELNSIVISAHDKFDFRLQRMMVIMMIVMLMIPSHFLKTLGAKLLSLVPTF